MQVHRIWLVLVDSCFFDKHLLKNSLLLQPAYGGLKATENGNELLERKLPAGSESRVAQAVADDNSPLYWKLVLQISPVVSATSKSRFHHDEDRSYPIWVPNRKQPGSAQFKVSKV